jgi:hypothetical protein
MTPNSTPGLLDELRPTLSEVAGWVGVSHGLANMWREEKSQPKPADRARLVKAVRKHAARLLKLADAVEREGHERATRRREATKDLFPRRQKKA